jgi:periplasmic protein TonB
MSDFESSQKVSPRMWALAALGALTIHFACVALALDYLRDDDSDEDLGAPAIEVGIELLARHVEPAELPPGPDVEASVASPKVVETKEAIEPSDLPHAMPVETEDPERVVAPIETNKPKTDEPNVPTTAAVPSVESIAVEATAVPSSEIIEESTRSVAPVQGTGESPQRIRATWQKELIAHFNRHKRYPADRSSQTAQILVSFVLDETGHVLSASILRGSGDGSFDEAALAMIRRSDPVPRPPSLVAQDGLNFTLPVIFRARRGD